MENTLNFDSKIFWLKIEINQLIREYREYQHYFAISNNPEQANLLYYNKKFSESGLIEESKFNLNHKSLFIEIKENKDKKK